MSGLWFGRVLTRYGGTAQLLHDGQLTQVRAFIQPTLGEQELPQTATALGKRDRRVWLYLGQGPLAVGDTVQWQGQDFAVRSAEPIRIGDALSHWWGTLECSREAAQ